MKLQTYVNFGGNCEEALGFYAANLGGKVTMMMKHGEAPPGSGNVPAEWGAKIMHAQLELGETVLMASDVPPPRFQPMRSAYLTLLADSSPEAERIFAVLSDGGEVHVPIAETFFAHRFAILRDKFGVSWMLLHQR